MGSGHLLSVGQVRAQADKTAFVREVPKQLWWESNALAKFFYPQCNFIHGCSFCGLAYPSTSCSRGGANRRECGWLWRPGGPGEGQQATRETGTPQE